MWPDRASNCHLGNFLKSVGTFCWPKLSVNFWKRVRIFHFCSVNFLGIFRQLYNRHWATFFSNLLVNQLTYERSQGGPMGINPLSLTTQIALISMTVFYAIRPVKEKSFFNRLTNALLHCCTYSSKNALSKGTEYLCKRLAIVRPQLLTAKNAWALFYLVEG